MGRVLIGNRDIRDVTVDSLRRQLSIVPQDPVLFHNTINYNIAYGRLSASHEEVLASSQMANLHNGVQNMPMKYETQVGERGLKLSGTILYSVCIKHETEDTLSTREMLHYLHAEANFHM